MESDDMDISESEEDEDDDDEAELDKLLSSLTGMEKCLLPVNFQSAKTVVAQDKIMEAKTSKPNENNNNDVLQENQAETLAEKTSPTRPEIVELDETVSPTNSNASTLSRESTPERQLSHCPKDCDKNQVHSDKNYDSDVIFDHVDKNPINLQPETSSDHSDIAYLGTKSDVTSLDTLSHNTASYVKDNDSVLLDDTAPNSLKNSQFEVEPPAVISMKAQSIQIENSLEDIDSDSDCLIVEHIAASDHRQNGLIDLTKPTSDDEASLPLEGRTEESLLKEISKIRKALTKHTKKKYKKKKKKHKTQKKKKSRSGTKSPSLEAVSESDNETRTIMVSESGHLQVNIVNDKSKTDSCDSDDSTRKNKSKNTIPPESEVNPKPSVNDSNSEGNSISTKDKETESNILPADSERSPLLWNSDCKNTEVDEKSNASIECNPLKRKLLYCVDNTTTTKQRKKIFCESGKEMKSKFRRSDNKLNAKRIQKKAISLDKTNKFNRYLSNSDDSDSSVKNDTVESFNPIKSRKSRKSIDSDEDKVYTLRLSSPSKSIRRSPPSSPRKSIDRFERSPSRSNYKSPSRSPLCYRRRSYSSYRNLSDFYRSPSHSRRSKSRHKTPAEGRDYKYRRSISRSYSPSYPSRSVRSPSRSRRSRSRPYRSPSRSRRSKSRTYRSPSRSRRSKSRTYRSPSCSRRSKSRTYKSPSRSHRCKSHHRTSRRRSNSRSPSEIRAARKCSPLEDMRKQLRKNNEAAVEQALGGLEKPKKNGAARIIDDVDLTKSPSPEIFAKFDRNAPTASPVRAVVSQPEITLHQYNATALRKNYSTSLHSSTGLRSVDPHSNYSGMPVTMMQNPGIDHQTRMFQISHVYSQAAGLPANYVPMYSHLHPPYM